MQRKILTWPMFIYAYSALIIFMFILDYFVACISALMDTLPSDNNGLVIPFMFYHVALIIAPINYLIERYLANDRKRKWFKGLLYLGVFVITFIFGGLNLKIRLKTYLFFMVIYVLIFTIISIKYKLPKSLKWYLD